MPHRGTADGSPGHESSSCPPDQVGEDRPVHPSDRDPRAPDGAGDPRWPSSADGPRRWVPGAHPGEAGRWVRGSPLPNVEGAPEPAGAGQPVEGPPAAGRAPAGYQNQPSSAGSRSGVTPDQPRRDEQRADARWPDEQPTAQLPRRTGSGWYPAPPPMLAPPPDSYRRDPYPQDPYRPDPYRPDPYRPDTYQPDTYQPDPYRSAANEPGPYQPDPYRPARDQPTARGSHLPPYPEPLADPPPPRPPGPPGTSPRTTPEAAATASPPQQPASTAPRTGPRKLTVTRVAAFRSRELTSRGVQLFQRAAAADGADRSGLTHLTYAVMGNYAVDAALAVALANTLFFAAATAESSSKVLLYLLITVAPFAVIAPLIGPMLDKLQHGRRIALATSSFARAVLAIVMALNFDSWALYPCALGMLVLSKSFGVLMAAVTPRVLPPDVTLVKINSRMTVFGMLAGGAAGLVAGALAWAFGSTGALVFTALLSVVGGTLCLRIPAWVESTEGEVPVASVGPSARPGRTFPLQVITTLWANGTIRVETGFLALFIAFVIKSQYSGSSGFTQLLLLGVVGAAAGVGGFVGNGLGARLPLNAPETTSILALAAVAVATLIAVLAPGLWTAAIVGLVGSTGSSLAKVCLDSVIQHELPEASRASAFGRSETVLQLSWVSGGVIGLLIGGVWSFGHDQVYSIGFAVITVLLVVGLVQSLLVRRGRSMFPWLDYSRLTKRFRRTHPAATAPVAPTTPWPVGSPPPNQPWVPGPPRPTTPTTPTGPTPPTLSTPPSPVPPAPPGDRPPREAGRPRDGGRPRRPRQHG